MPSSYSAIPIAFLVPFFFGSPALAQIAEPLEPLRASEPLSAGMLGNPLSASTSARLGAASSSVTSVRARQIELHYQLSGGSAEVDLELWYTRDRGTSWQCYGKDDDRTSPILFSAPSEGLYGFTLIPLVAGERVRSAPAAYETPQRWVFIDATPPLAQWNGVEPAENFVSTRVLQLRWTAHDDNLAARPVSLSFQSSVNQAWTDIDTAVANTGVYDWRVPETVSGQVTLKLIVRDQGGHAVERTFGPVALDRFFARHDSREALEPDDASGRPTAISTADLAGLSVATQPEALPRVDLLQRRMAADLLRQGSWHLVRGQYGVAAERLREALEHDPDLLEARHDLAGIFYRQQDYDRAITEYETVLARNANYESALYGAALAYVAKRDYHRSREMLTRLLKLNERNAEAWLDLGDVLFMTGDVINARANWRQAMKIDPSAKEIAGKAQRRLELYGTNSELSSTKKE